LEKGFFLRKKRGSSKKELGGKTGLILGSEKKTLTTTKRGLPSFEGKEKLPVTGRI